jgi:CheY-like chemotaxis protein
MRVLVVDDDRDIREELADYLTAAGHDALTAPDGKAALTLCRAEQEPDVILLDLWMPVMDGWDFRAAQLADAALAHIPVIAISACGFSPRTVLDQLKVTEFVAKPPNIDALDAALSRVRADHT